MSEYSGATNKAWEQLFEKYDIPEQVQQNGQFHIRAAQIKEFREPRLMAKFDHSRNLPKPFKDHRLSILPCARGEYLISNFKAYHKIKLEQAPVYKVSYPSHIQSLEHTKITSEAIALNCAFVAGIIADFLEDEELVPTVSGRMSSGNFNFDIKSVKDGSMLSVGVQNSQIEIDAGYEGIRCLGVVEAKIDISDDFIVRQLYYPYRLMASQITKPVKPVMMFYSNGIFRLYEYVFERPNEYNSLVLVKQKNYTIDDTEITTEDIRHILSGVQIVPEPVVPFPQADIFERVINLCELLYEKPRTKDELTAIYDFDIRQTDYYANSARYLGLLDKYMGEGGVTYILTADGLKVMFMENYKKRQLFIVRKILEHKPFHWVMSLYFEAGEMPSTETIVDIMKRCNVYAIEEESTYGRRAQSVRSWINWIAGLITA